MENITKIINDFEDSLLNINRIRAAQILEQCYQSEKSFVSLEQIVMKTLERIGQGWENGTIALSQVYMSGVICEELIDKYLPRLDIKRKNIPKMGIGVLLDRHSLGKRIVYSVLRAAGFDIVDLGSGISVDDIVDETIKQKIEILLISTLMLPSALKIKDVRKKLDDSGKDVKIIVGGAPFRFDDKLWIKVDADADGKTAVNAIEVINGMTKEEVLL